MTWGWIVIAIGWTIGAWFAAHPAKPDLSAFDLRRCYALHQRLHCWPHDGCWIDGNGDAICWRIGRLKRKTDAD